MAVRHLQFTNELQERASLFAAGALPEGERLEYARHLEEDRCQVCVDEVREFQSAASLLALEAPLETPSPRVRERLLEQARSASVRVTPGARPHRRWLEWTAGIAAIAASTALVFVLYDNARLRSLADSLSDRVARLESQLTEQRVRLASLSSPQVRVVNLAGQGTTPGASGRIFWDQTKRRWLFFAENLPPVAGDKSYQLWFVPPSGNPVSASVFNTNASGAVEIEISVPANVSEVKLAAVTTEPAGGVPQPTGAFALVGEIR